MKDGLFAFHKVPFRSRFSIVIFRNRGLCVNEPFAHGLTLRKEGQVELLGRRLTDLARVRVWQTAVESVNTLLQIAGSTSRNAVSFSSVRTMKRFP
jgi:hypothetical protein